LEFEYIPRATIFGLATDDLVFLAGTFLVWYLFGRTIDQRGAPGPSGAARRTITLAVHVFLLAVGGLLGYIGLFLFEHPAIDSFILEPRPYRGILTLLWAASLIFFSGRALMTAARRFLRAADQLDHFLR